MLLWLNPMEDNITDVMCLKKSQKLKNIEWFCWSCTAEFMNTLWWHLMAFLYFRSKIWEVFYKIAGHYVRRDSRKITNFIFYQNYRMEVENRCTQGFGVLLNSFIERLFLHNTTQFSLLNLNYSRKDLLMVFAKKRFSVKLLLNPWKLHRLENTWSWQTTHTLF